MSSLMKPKKNKSPFIELTVKETVRLFDDVIYIKFEEEMDYLPGQFISILFEIDDEKYLRQYSICSAPSVEKNPAIVVKKREKGIVSKYLVEEITQDDVQAAVLTPKVL